MRITTDWRAAIAAILATSALGCGGTVFTSSSDAAVPDSATPDAPVAVDATPPPPSDAGAPDAQPPLSPLCPSTPPLPGSSCSHANLECEYGTAYWSIGCDAVMQCQQGTWSKEAFGSECNPKPGPNVPSCPADYASVVMGAACSENGVSCTYPQGLCSCSLPVGGPVIFDAGASWSCLPGTMCPWPRPLLGSACTTPGQSCTYQECGYGQECEDGTWHGSPLACGL